MKIPNDCAVCGECPVRIWEDKMRDEMGWSCQSASCAAGGRVTRYTREWLREQLGKRYFLIVMMLCGSMFLASLVCGMTVAIRTPDPKLEVRYKPIQQQCAVHADPDCTLTSHPRCDAACLFDNRSGTPQLVGCNPSIDVFDVARRIGCSFGPAAADGGI